MAFRVGQKAVCISGRTSTSWPIPKKGEVVTISNLYTAPDGDLMLEAVEYPQRETAETHAGFRAKFFRPVAERKTDTGFAVLEEIRQRETEPARPKVPASLA